MVPSSFNVQTPVHLLKWTPEMRFTDQMDRDYELWEYNAHPYQMFFYEFYNNLRQQQIENQELRNQGMEPIEDQVLRVAEERIAAEQQSTGREVDKMRQVRLIRLKSSWTQLDKETQ